MQRLLRFLPLLFLAACSLDESKLIGKWRATVFYENGQTLPATLDSVSLAFTPEGGYEFRSIGFYHESGHFRTANKYLFLTDTTVHPPKERTLEVLFLSPDSLKIGMANGGKKQVLFLVK